MDFLNWLHQTKHMTTEERSRAFHNLSDNEQTLLMDSNARSSRVTRRGNVKHFFKGVR